MRMQRSYLPRVSSTTKFFFPQEKVIPSVVIEPASNNEGEGEHEITIGAESKEATGEVAVPGPPSETSELATEQKATEDSQPAPTAPSASEAAQEVPPGFLYKVLTLLILLDLISICPSFTVRPFCSNSWFLIFTFSNTCSFSVLLSPPSQHHIATWQDFQYDVFPYFSEG